MRIRFLEDAQREVDDAVPGITSEKTSWATVSSMNSTELFAGSRPFRWLQLKSSLESEEVC